MKPEKSFVQLQVEADLNAPASRGDGAARRLRILAGAVQECSEVGIKEVSIAGVARRARISTATLYREHKDKSDLITQCMAYVMPLLAQSITTPIHDLNPFLCIKNMLIVHGKTIGDPFMTWLYRLYVGAGYTDEHNNVVNIARLGRLWTEVFWAEKLIALEQQGYLKPSAHIDTVNLLLGQIERRTILAQLLHGSDDVAEPSLEAVAHFAATGLFANLGTEAFHKAFA